MAYGLKWYNEFTTVDADLVRVEIHQRDYVGSPTEVKRAGSTPVVISLAEDATSNPFDPIRPTRAKVEWISDTDSNFNIQNLFITDDQEFELFVKINGSVVWAGFVIHSDCQEPYLDRPYPVQFQATCGLAFLDRYTVLDGDGKYLYGTHRIKDTFIGALSQVGHGFDIEDCTNLTNPYSVVVPNYRSIINNATIDGDGTRDMTCMEFLAGVLNAANSFIVQSNGKWVIQSVRVLTEGQFDRVLFDSGYNYKSDGKVSKTVEIIDPETDQSIKYPSQKLRPTPSVIEKLAQPKSKVRVNVSPGVQVNRLVNGSFVPSGGTVPGWRLVAGVGGTAQTIGTGTPDDPYIFQFGNIGNVNNRFIESDRIELDIEEFGAEETEAHNIKVRFSGTVWAANTPYLALRFSVNWEERKWVDYLLNDGTWDQRKEAQPKLIITTPLKVEYDIDIDNFEPVNFDFESKPITNWVERSGKWKAYIQLRTLAVPAWVLVETGTNATFWFQDFAVCIDTGTPYEGDHAYEIDATKIILNGEEYTYEITVADKINIDTLEQKRAVNRVMTGYMTFALSLTKDWTRVVDGVADPLDSTPKPIQHLSLKERIRLLCGKRSILEGTFYGKGLWPDSRIENGIEDNRKPMMVTGWEWDIKHHSYKASLFELDFTPLSNEEIYLVEEETNGSGRKSRSGGGGGSSGSLSARKPIKIDDLPAIHVTKGQKVSYAEDVEDYVVSSQDIDLLTLRLLSKPSWAQVAFDGLVIEISGTPDESGEDQVLVEVSDGSGDEYIISIPVQVYPVTLVTYTITPGGKITPGLPKQIVPAPPYTATIRVEGGHDRYQWEVKGPGLSDTSGPTVVTYTEDATYTPFSGENLAEGIYNISIVTWRDTAGPDDEDPIWTEVHRSTAVVVIGTNLGDDDPDRTVKVTLEPVGAELTGAETAVEYLEEWNIALEPIGLIHDKLFVSIMPEEDPFMAELYPNVTPMGSAGSNQKLDPSDGSGLSDPDWYVTEFSGAYEGERYWSDGDFFLYNGATFVSHHPAGEIIVPAGVDTIKTNKKDASPSLNQVDFDDYTLFPSLTSKPAGAYSGFVRAFLDGDVVYEKFVKFTIQEEEIPEPSVDAGLVLVEPGSVFTTIANLPLSGGVYPLPANGWNVLCPDFGGTEFDTVDWTLEQDLGGWAEIDITRYTSRASEKTYTIGPGGAGEISANAYLFWTKSSKDIGSIHTAPSRFRATFTAWREGAKVGIRQSDFLFRPAGPVGDPSGLVLAYREPGDSTLIVIEESVPETGGYYPIEESEVALGRKWVLNPKYSTYDGVTPFNGMKVYVNGFLVASPVNPGGSKYTDIGVPMSDYLDWGDIDSEGNRIVGGVNIDLPGSYDVKYEFYDDSVLIGTRQAEIYLYEPEPTVKDPSQCCSGGSGSGVGETREIYFPANTEWVWNHGFSFKPIFRIIIGGEEWDTAVTHTLGTTIIHWNRPRAGYIVFED